MARILVTGAAGFIGHHTCVRLRAEGREVIGVDTFSDYYDPALKRARVAQLPDVPVIEADLADTDAVEALFAAHNFEHVIHLAAQPGVRHSLVDPMSYTRNNLVAFTNILEACRHNGIAHLVYASTSSVYGANTAMPYREDRPADHPLQFYAATKRANELMAHSYSHLYRLPTTALRFFTVYGPWGRPDMSPWLFTEAILQGQPIKVFNHGRHMRDFTYIDDIVSGIVGACDHPAAPDPDWNANDPDVSSSDAPFRVLNIGAADPVELNDYIEAIEDALGMKAKRELLPLQPGDVPDTFADVSRLSAMTGYEPTVSIREGVRRFVEWYRSYHGV